MTVVLPGDAVPLASTSALKLGPGLLPTPPSTSTSTSTAATPSPSLTAIRTGALGHIGASQASSSSSSSVASSKPKHAESAAVWVESNTQRVRPTRRLISSLFVEPPTLTDTDILLLCSALSTHARQYVPAPGDSVVAQITNRGADSYTVSLFGAHAATLPALAFEGATKRHKPNLNIGALVYARIVSADRFTEPELTCLNPLTAKSDGFGHLKTTDHRGEKVAHAMLFHTSLGLARSLLRPDHPLLGLVAAHFPFEAAIGQNGAVWVRANEPSHLVAVGRLLHAADLHPTAHSSLPQHPSPAQDDQATLHAQHILDHRAQSWDAKRVRALIHDLL
ncbi:exosome complex exonuclease rrp40 [Moesziomyces antarcticus]|uniref:Ribosomal RNA-processing protein 40 n=1 Tax=Pseudozyma antarctica TaxID=84753 RepID=A0A081CM58_PSEA2|nr:exosome complex exonuclease rrp40 [Moesziomyces antarcticus]GAK67754.1 exosome complex exonuclease rrp40 [Moesziomyces antarcticus]